jgi:predicted phage-related endonuclease
VSFQPSFDPIAAAKLGLSRMELETRIHSIRGSDANIIAGDDLWKINRLISVKRGEAEPEDLSRNKACMLGTYNEALNVRFFEMDTGLRVHGRNSTADHPFEPHYGCSRDGMVDHPQYGETVFEAKYTSQTNLETITRTYYPQVVHNMDCSGVKWAILSAIMGGTKYGFVSVELDMDYLAALRARTDMVWEAIQGDGILGPLPEMPKPVMPAMFLRAEPVDLATLKEANEIGSLAPDYIRTFEAAKLHTKVAKKLKGLMPEDAADMTGFGLKGTRNAAGALTLIPAPEKTDTVNKDA